MPKRPLCLLRVSALAVLGTARTYFETGRMALSRQVPIGMCASGVCALPHSLRQVMAMERGYDVQVLDDGSEVRLRRRA